jgi:hypothetical protein
MNYHPKTIIDLCPKNKMLPKQPPPAYPHCAPPCQSTSFPLPPLSFRPNTVDTWRSSQSEEQLPPPQLRFQLPRQVEPHRPPCQNRSLCPHDRDLQILLYILALTILIVTLSLGMQLAIEMSWRDCRNSGRTAGDLASTTPSMGSFQQTSEEPDTAKQHLLPANSQHYQPHQPPS